MKNQKLSQWPSDYEQIIKVSSLKNIGRKISEAMIKEHGFYTCMLSGIKTLVVADNEII